MPNIQDVAQEIINSAITEDEQLVTNYSITHEQKEKLANAIWVANGAVENDPLTLNNWLEAEVLLETQMKKVTHKHG